MASHALVPHAPRQRITPRATTERVTPRVTPRSASSQELRGHSPLHMRADVDQRLLVTRGGAGVRSRRGVGGPLSLDRQHLIPPPPNPNAPASPTGSANPHVRNPSPVRTSATSVPDNRREIHLATQTLSKTASETKGALTLERQLTALQKRFSVTDEQVVCVCACACACACAIICMYTYIYIQREVTYVYICMCVRIHIYTYTNTNTNTNTKAYIHTCTRMSFLFHTHT
jgi:hypothetical protein